MDHSIRQWTRPLDRLTGCRLGALLLAATVATSAGSGHGGGTPISGGGTPGPGGTPSPTSGTPGPTPAAHPSAAPTLVGSTKPANGDVNPYGVAIVPRAMGALRKGDVLVSNFNNAANQAGRGTTIVRIAPNGTQRLFAQINPQRLPGACPGGVGLTTALTVLQRGYVIVGSLPTADGAPATAQAGCLLVLNASGQVISTITAPDINGPWDLTARDQGNRATLFVSNVLNGTVAAYDTATKKGKVVNEGTVARLVLQIPHQGVPQVLSNTIVASGFAEQADPNALVIGPTGLGLGPDGALYVADTLENRIAAIPQALSRNTGDDTGRDLSAGGALNGPLGLAMVPNGDILTVNANDGNLVETDIAGTQVQTATVSMAGTPPGVGALFGLAVAPNGDIYFTDDNAVTLNRWAGSGGADRAVATLASQNGSAVGGVAFLTKGRRPGTVEVSMQVTGLAPNSVHPTHIHRGASCTAGGPILYPFPTLTANAQGVAILQTAIDARSIPSSGWYINVHQGPGMGTSLACGVVMPPM